MPVQEEAGNDDKLHTVSESLVNELAQLLSSLQISAAATASFNDADIEVCVPLCQMYVVAHVPNRNAVDFGII